ADFAKIPHSLRRLVGQYSSTKVNPKNIPDDDTIADNVEKQVETHYEKITVAYEKTVGSLIFPSV
ncbi:MAG: hypothetical protein RLZZ490_534, partial [Cyanobacteriota bacterium]